MKIVRPTEVTVTFEDAGEAARWLAGYLNAPTRYRQTEFEYPAATPEEHATNEAAEAEAIRILADQADRAIPGITVRGNPFPKSDPRHAAPTYISGSSDRVYLISEMPTRYIQNVLAMEGYRIAVGVARVLQAELNRRALA